MPRINANNNIREKVLNCVCGQDKPKTCLTEHSIDGEDADI
jgi:hypothetical protein